MSTFEHPQRQSLGNVLRDLLLRLRRLEAIPPRAVFEFKLFADAIWPDSVALVTVGDGRFVWMVDEQLDGAALLSVQTYVTTVGTGATSVMVTNTTTVNEMLTDTVDIASGDITSPCGARGPIDPDNDRVSACDLISLDVTAAGTGAKGLGVILTFGGF